MSRHGRRGGRFFFPANLRLTSGQDKEDAGCRMRDQGGGLVHGPCYPEGLLRGEDKFVRHIRLQKPHIDEPAFRALLKQAALWQSPRLT